MNILDLCKEIFYQASSFTAFDMSLRSGSCRYIKLRAVSGSAPINQANFLIWICSDELPVRRDISPEISLIYLSFSANISA